MDDTDPRKAPWWRMLDLPPLWLFLFLALAGVQSARWPVWAVDIPLMDLLAGVLVGAGVLLMGLAFVELRRARTTVMPHQEADALVTTGVFARTRNPIYLGDVLIMTGMILFWKAWPSLILVPLFMWLVTDRFIRPEEARLAARFGARFEGWRRRVRRWI